MEKMGVDQRSQQIVRGSDGVKIAVEVQVYFLAGLELGQAATGSSTLHSKDRSKGRFTGGDDRFLADVLQPLGQADGGDSFAFAGNGGGGGGDQDQFSAAFEGGISQELQAYFPGEGT